MNANTEVARLKAELTTVRAELAQQVELFKAACQIADDARREVIKLKGTVAKARATERQETVADALSSLMRESVRPNLLRGDLQSNISAVQKQASRRSPQP